MTQYNKRATRDQKDTVSLLHPGVHFLTLTWKTAISLRKKKDLKSITSIDIYAGNKFLFRWSQLVMIQAYRFGISTQESN